MTSPRTCALLLTFLALGQTSATAQAWFLSGEVARSIQSGQGIVADCLSPDHRTGLGIQIGPQVGHAFTLLLTGRAFVISHAPDCVDGFPPPSGTFIENDRTDLHATAFGTSDLRMRVRLGPDLVGVTAALGVGAAWHEGRDWPYAVAAVGSSIAVAKRTRIAFTAEYQALHLSWNQYRRTYQDFQVIASVPLGTVRHWSHDILLNISVEARF